MRQESNAVNAAEVTNWKSAFVGALITVLGCICAGLSSTISSAWIQNTAIALSTTLVSTGLLSILFEVLLRRNVYREMVNLSGLSRELTSQQLVSAGKAPDVEWQRVFKSKSVMRFIIIDPSSWIDQHIVSLLGNGRQRPITIEFIFPDPQASSLPMIAESVGKDVEAYRHSLRAAVERVERAWNEAKARSTLTLRSQLTIRITAERPLYSLALCDDISIVQIPSIIGQNGSDVDYFYEHYGDRGAYPSSWFTDQISRLGPLPIRFQDEVLA